MPENGETEQQQILPGELSHSVEFEKLLTNFHERKIAPKDFYERFMQPDFEPLRQNLAYMSAVRRSSSSVDGRDSIGMTFADIALQNFYLLVSSPPAFLSAPSKLRVLISYNNHDRNTLDIVSELYNCLEGKFDIIPVEWHIYSFQEWHRDLYTATYLSHAAVMLFSKDMFDDEKVQKTIGLFTARTLKHVDSFKFVFVPVLIDQMQSSNLTLANSSLIFPELKTFSPIQSNNPTEICSQVLSRLQALPKFPPATKLDILGQRIGNILRNSTFRDQEGKDQDLHYIASNLEISLDSKIDVAYKQIGWAMWRKNILTVEYLFEYLSDILESSGTKDLLNILFPSWIDPWSAHWVPIAAERPPGQRAIVLNRLDSDIVDCFVRRAYRRWPNRYPVKKVINMSSDSSDGSSINNLIHRIRQQLIKELKCKEPELEKRLLIQTTDIGPVFVALPLPEPEDLERLMQEFKYVTFFVLTKENVPEDTALFGNVIFPQPALCEKDFAAYDSYLCLMPD